jgi:hypothetical protein
MSLLCSAFETWLALVQYGVVNGTILKSMNNMQQLAGMTNDSDIALFLVGFGQKNTFATHSTQEALEVQNACWTGRAGKVAKFARIQAQQ